MILMIWFSFCIIRILANRQSAQRSRVRKLQYISELERSVTSLQVHLFIGDSNKINFIQAIQYLFNLILIFSFFLLLTYIMLINEGRSLSIVSTSCIFGSSTFASNCWQQCIEAKNRRAGPRQDLQRWYLSLLYVLLSFIKLYHPSAYIFLG